MDFGAVIQASDDILYQLGLVRKGDIPSLRGFCEGKLEEKANGDRKDARDETKRKLLAELFSQKQKKKSGVKMENEAAKETNIQKRKLRLDGFNLAGFISMNTRGGLLPCGYTEVAVQGRPTSLSVRM